MYFPIQFLFPYRLLHNIDYSSQYYTVGLCWLSVSIKFSCEKPEEGGPVPCFFKPGRGYSSLSVSSGNPKMNSQESQEVIRVTLGLCGRLCLWNTARSHGSVLLRVPGLGILRRCRYWSRRGTWDSASLTSAWEMRFCWPRNHILRNRACEILSAS